MLGRLTERRSSAFQNLFASGALDVRPSATGLSVNTDTSLRLSAFYACVRLISDTISTLPVDQFFREDGQRIPFRPRDRWVDNPNPSMPRPTFWNQVLVSLLIDGNAFVQIIRDAEQEIYELHVLNPNLVEILDTGFRVNSSTFLPRDEVLHVAEMILPGQRRGVSRLDAGRDAIGLGLALQEFSARFFGNGAYPGVVLEFPTELTKDQADEIQQSWDAKHRGVARSHRPAILMNGAKANVLSVNPSDSQLMDERKFAVLEMARMFRVPPFMLGVTEAGASYASVEQQYLFFTQQTLLPYTELLEAAFSRLLDSERSFIKFNLNSLARADLATRTASYSTALMAGYMSVNDVRRLEDMRDVTEGGQYRVPLQNIPLTDTPVITVGEKARAAQSLIISGFTPQSVAQLLDLDLDHTGLASVQLQDEVKNPDAGVVAD
jgi:HK97 family phage portal protein